MVERVAPEPERLLADMQDLLDWFGAAETEELVDDTIQPEVERQVFLFEGADGWELGMSYSEGLISVLLEFPMTEKTFWEYVEDLDEQLDDLDAEYDESE